MNKKVFLFVRIVITFAILFALFKFIPYGKVIEVYKNSQKIYIFLGFLAFFLCYVFAVVRWNFLLSSLGVKVSLKETFYAFFSSLFFNLFFPSFIAGDVFRGFSISQRHGNKKKVASSILMDRFSGAAALVLIAIFAFAAGGGILAKKSVVMPLFILCVVISFSFMVIFSKSFFLFLTKILKNDSVVKKKLAAFHDELYFFSKNPAIFIKSLFFSFLIQFFTCLSFYVISKAFGSTAGIIHFLILVPLVTAIAVIPITIAGLGTREASAVYFFSHIGIAKSIGLGISLLNLVFLIFMSILGGIFYVTVYHRWIQSNS